MANAITQMILSDADYQDAYFSEMEDQANPREYLREVHGERMVAAYDKWVNAHKAD